MEAEVACVGHSSLRRLLQREGKVDVCRYCSGKLVELC